MLGISSDFSHLLYSMSLPNSLLQMALPQLLMVKHNFFIYLSSTFYIPYFSFNLINVNKLTEQLNFSITFFPDSIVIQDLKTKKMIGEGHESNDLYY